MEFSVVVPTLNGREYLVRCLSRWVWKQSTDELYYRREVAVIGIDEQDSNE
jgi:glycosyltransferase involved in cell wall biosynthesis